MAEEETPVETTEEQDAPQASEETPTNETEATADEATADEATADEAIAGEASADEATADEVAAEPDLSESLSEVEAAPVETERVEVEDGRDYELIFIVRITESTDGATERVRAVIEQSGGVVDNVRVSDQRRLAYPIKKEIEGFYVVVNGRYTKEAAAELDRVLKLDEAILRHMTIRLDEE